MKRLLFIVVGLLVAATAVYLFIKKTNIPVVENSLLSTSPGKSVTDFTSCVLSGYPVMESYPRRCKSADGEIYVEDIGNALLMQNEIILDQPLPNQVITSPLVLDGKAKGSWFFEAIFTARLEDLSGREMGRGVLTANGEWMTEEMVNFSGRIDFKDTITDSGKLILDNANPSGLAENHKELIIPVKFR